MTVAMSLCVCLCVKEIVMKTFRIFLLTKFYFWTTNDHMNTLCSVFYTLPSSFGLIFMTILVISWFSDIPGHEMQCVARPQGKPYWPFKFA